MISYSQSIALATSNPHKLTEFQAIAACLYPVGVVCTTPLPDSVEESGETFEANARIKLLAALPLLEGDARYLVAEDAGLVVPALSGHGGLVDFPGVRSNRWLPGADTPTRNRALLDLLAALPATTPRAAYYVSVMVGFDREREQTFVAEGRMNLTVAYQPDGRDGFGYDPIMCPEGYSDTVASLGAPLKNQLSHRRQAVEALLAQLE
jgi:XTP/dITP diphosphohydrolase